MDLKSAQAELAQLQAKGTAFLAKSADQLTDREVTELEAINDRAIQLKGMIVGLKNAERMDDFAQRVGGTEDAWENGAPTDYPLHNGAGAKGFITPASAKAMARTATAPMAKALVAGGSAVTPVALNQSPLVLATPPANLGILGVVPVVKRDTPSYSYLRQSLRTNNAAVVAPGALKPTSVFTVEEVKASLSVIGHLSEYVDSYLLRDNSQLESFLASELQGGIFQKVTELAVAAYAGVSGAQTQAFSTNIADSLFLGASKAADLGYSPDVVLISRAAANTLLLAKDGQGNYLYKRDEDSRINGLYPVIATGLPANTAVVLDSSKVQISTDTDGILTKWDAVTKMDYNQVRALVEGRFQFDVLAAPAIVKVALV